MTLRIVTIVGARPQFVKAAVVSRALRARAGVEEILIHTGQHYDENMSAIFYRELEIAEPACDLAIGSGSHGAQTGAMLAAIEERLLAQRPHWVLVYGDTNSTLAGALAAVKLHIPVAHVEAGLRSFNRRMPEEINRVLTDHASDLLLAPTAVAVGNLAREGVPAGRVHEVGDVMYDAALFYGHKAEQESRILEHLGLASKAYILATVHRAENTDDPIRMRAIFEGLGIVARQVPVVLPLHPRTRKVLQGAGLEERLPPELRIIEPVGYLDMARLERHARLVATDSGGVQKEAFFYRVPCATLRDETEWLELVELGWNRLVPTQSAQDVAQGVLAGLGHRGREGSPYGDGAAAGRIVSLLMRS